MRLVGEKVILRWPKIQDAQWLFENFKKPEIASNLTSGAVEKVKTIKDEEAWIRSRSAKRRAKKGYAFMVTDKGTNALLGTCGVNELDLKNSNCGIGYWLAKKYWGKGYATDFLNLLLKFCFDTLDMHAVYAYTADFNERSQGLLKKTGFKYCGTFREHVIFNGKRVNVPFYDLLKSEWKN